MTENEIKALNWMRSIKDDTLLISESSIETFEKQFGDIETFIRNEININAEIIEQSLEELDKYRSIGTVSECREAVKKQRAKSPNIWGDGYVDGQLIYDMYDCPNCGESYEIDYSDYDYCPKCGQKINRTNLEKMEE